MEPIKTKCEVCGSKVLLHGGVTQFYTPDTEDLDKAKCDWKAENEALNVLRSGYRLLKEELDALKCEKAERNDKSADLLIQAVWDVRASRKRIEKLTEALRKISDPRIMDHKEPDYYTQLGCVRNVAFEALKADSESEGK